MKHAEVVAGVAVVHPTVDVHPAADLDPILDHAIQETEICILDHTQGAQCLQEGDMLGIEIILLQVGA